MKMLSHYNSSSLNSSWNGKCFSQIFWRKSKRILFLIIFIENRAVYDIMWKNMVEPDTPQVTV